MTTEDVYAYKRWFTKKYPYTDCILHPDLINEWHMHTIMMETELALNSLIELSQTIKSKVAL